ncbi:MAG: Brp/Blh family beta-carotene 15,15'-dioxygenase [Pyrinomonadaceae bacterium]|nr:Brp/Blh family beta-carotene 15,15'-dioxygenase [Pyrinomonadaceae bacterium]
MSSNRLALFGVPWFSVIAAIVLGVILANRAETFGAWFLIVSALFFGLPHGACDFWILQRSFNRENKLLKIGLSLTSYLVLVCATIWLWLNFAGFALIGFLLLSAWHFGSGDAIWTSNGFKQFLIQSTGRGLLIIFAPLVFYPDESRATLLPLTENSPNAELIWSIAPFLLIIGIVLQFGASIFTSRATAFILLIENVLLLTLFAFTTPLFAVAVYLIGVHSWRHLWRLENNFATETLSLEKSWRVAFDFHVRALPFTILSLVGIVLIFWLWDIRLVDLAQFTKVYLILLSALTVPHATLVLLMEMRKN